MKKFVLAFVLMSIPVVAQSRGPLTGRWRIHGWIDGDNIVSQCNFTQSGTTLRGTCASAEGAVEVVGQFKGAIITFSYSTDYNGIASTLTFSGNIVGQHVNGNIVVDPDGTIGRFIANRLN